jgi:glycyl-tRNA synthetase beta chain
VSASLGLDALVDTALEPFAGSLTIDREITRASVFDFFGERELHLLEKRGFRVDEAKAVIPHWKQPHAVVKRAEALAQARTSKEFETLAALFKRVKNITKDFDRPLTDDLREKLIEPAERALLAEVDRRGGDIEHALRSERYGDAMRELVALSVPVDRFFVDVLVMAEDRDVREARLALLSALRRTILNLADIAEIAPEETRQA